MSLNNIPKHILFEQELPSTTKENITDKILTCLVKNPNPTDEFVHDWAEKNGYDVHKVEEIIYSLATLFARFFKGGRYNESGPTDFHPNELEMGIKVEYEHTPDAIVARKIALDHLSEMPDYYTKLAKMEGDSGDH